MLTNAYDCAMMIYEVMEMYQEQRLEKIIELLKERKELSTADMMSYFDVSRDTVRRDVVILAQQGRVKRTHGGIIYVNHVEPIPSFIERIERFAESKEKIANQAKSFLEINGTYFFDASTVLLKLAQQTKLEATIYSHSLDNAILFSETSTVDFHLLGGKFYKKNRFYFSLEESKILEEITVDCAFFGAGGLSNGEVTFEDQEDAYVKKLVLRRAKTKILLAENEKFNKISTYSIGSIEQFDYLITDTQPPKELFAALGDSIKIIYPGSEVK